MLVFGFDIGSDLAGNNILECMSTIETPTYFGHLLELFQSQSHLALCLFYLQIRENALAASLICNNVEQRDSKSR